MSISVYALTAWLAAINAITVFLYWQDKRLSRQPGASRVPEGTLLLAAFIGGSPGAYAAMNAFRHKTKKTSFRMRFWLTVLVQLGAMMYFYNDIAVYL